MGGEAGMCPWLSDPRHHGSQTPERGCDVLGVEVRTA